MRGARPGPGAGANIGIGQLYDSVSEAGSISIRVVVSCRSRELEQGGGPVEVRHHLLPQFEAIAARMWPSACELAVNVSLCPHTCIRLCLRALGAYIVSAVFCASVCVHVCTRACARGVP